MASGIALGEAQVQQQNKQGMQQVQHLGQGPTADSCKRGVWCTCFRGALQDTAVSVCGHENS
jgi:hypothetical protein